MTTGPATVGPSVQTTHRFRTETLTSSDCSNQLSDTSAPCFTRLLGECPNLRTLNLACNRIGDGGAAGLAEGLLLTPSLTR